MIEVTKFDDSKFLINPHLIETIESTPDTVITLMSGRKIIVKDPAEKIVELIIKYRKKIANILNQNDL